MMVPLYLLTGFSIVDKYEEMMKKMQKDDEGIINVNKYSDDDIRATLPLCSRNTKAVG
jgi:hypothetical protein